MKILPCVLIWVLSTAVSASVVRRESSKQVPVKEDSEFWNRFLGNCELSHHDCHISMLVSMSLSMSPFPTSVPSSPPTTKPSSKPSTKPSHSPSSQPSVSPSHSPSAAPSHAPSTSPSHSPSATPSHAPSTSPSHSPSTTPSYAPSASPSHAPSSSPSHPPSATPSHAPSASPSHSPSAAPSHSPSATPSHSPSAAPSHAPSTSPSHSPSATPSHAPSSSPSHSPSAAPSHAPSTSPSHSPSTTPSHAPSASPSHSPSAAPSHAPSTSPSNSPSATPSHAPSTSPSHSPSAAPSHAPSASPSHSPSATPSLAPSTLPSRTPTSAPSAAPSHYPSSVPSTTPTLAPTASCVLDVTVNCTLPGFGNETCEVDYPGVAPCAGRAYIMGFLLRGGFCNESYNIQPNKFACNDYEVDGRVAPRPRSGDLVYLVVEPLKQKNPPIIYFEGWINEGDYWEMDGRSTAQGVVAADSHVRMYVSNVTTDANLLQNASFHTSCSQNLRLKDTFGSNQLVLFVNEAQGNISCFASIEYNFTVTIPLDIVGDSVTITSLTGSASWLSPTSSFNLTDQVTGMAYVPGQSLDLTIPGTIDLTMRQEYTVLIRIEGFANNNQRCSGISRDTFIAGVPVPPTFPTLMPTRAPTSSPYPTPDPETSACELDATITCKRASLASSQQCSTYKSPAGLGCTSETWAGGIQFQYLPVGASYGQEIWVDVIGEQNFLAFSGVVQQNQVLNAIGGLKKGVNIQIFNVVNGVKGGTLFQSFNVDTTCQDPTALVIGKYYGNPSVLRLTGFLRGQDRVMLSIFIDLEFQYFVNNRGPLSATATEAYINSPFQMNPFQSLTSPQAIPGEEAIQVFSEVRTIDLESKESNNTIYHFAMNVTGFNPDSNVGCGATGFYSF